MGQIIKRGILQTFHPTSYTADVLLFEATSCALLGVPVSNALDGTSGLERQAEALVCPMRLRLNWWRPKKGYFLPLLLQNKSTSVMVGEGVSQQKILGAVCPWAKRIGTEDKGEDSGAFITRQMLLQ